MCRLARYGDDVTVKAKRRNAPDAIVTVRWMSVGVAAERLGMSAEALRKAIDRRAVRAADGGTEAAIDGLRARKLGQRWLVTLSEAWTTPRAAVGSPA